MLLPREIWDIIVAFLNNVGDDQTGHRHFLSMFFTISYSQNFQLDDFVDNDFANTMKT